MVRAADAARHVAKPRIALAEDDERSRRTLSWLLAEHGYDVSVVPGGEAPFEHLRTMHPDLLLIDVDPPAARGYETLERMQADASLRQVPVLALSALPQSEAVSRLLSLGAADCLSKPFRARELLARIQVQLRLRRELLAAREVLKTTEDELQRARLESQRRGNLVDILHEVTGDLSPEEISHLLVRRVARALRISHCSLILASPGDRDARVATAYENPGIRDLKIDLRKYPEIRLALDRGEAVLVEDVRTDALYDGMREEWAAQGTEVPIQSVIALPFELDERHRGVFFLRTRLGEPKLSHEDVEFAETVVRAAVGAMRRAHVIEATRADKARLEVLATTDHLTLALNRRAFMERLTAEMDRARRYALSVALLMVDIDHFKRVNDTYGHLVGDEVLREIAKTLQREARTVDVVARYGGEEFCVILPETSVEGATALAERVRARIAAQPAMPDKDYRGLHVTVSIGVATIPNPRVNSPEDLIALADEALYRAKAEGRNRVCA
jgi:two-component system cell cycle response regulator